MHTALALAALLEKEGKWSCTFNSAHRFPHAKIRKCWVENGKFVGEMGLRETVDVSERAYDKGK